MASIYASAYLTIAATRSENAHGGLYGEPPPERASQVHWFGSGDSAYPVYTREETFHKSFRNSELPLLKRAWAFQERLLSPRVVHFGDMELYWECFTETKTESEDHVTNAKFSKAEYLGNVLKADIDRADDDSSLTSSSNRWRSIVTRYCLRSLTYGQDIFPAIQGVAKIFQAERQCAYYAGLWEDTLLYDLLWSHKEGTTKSRPYRAPSWSWASNYYPTDADVGQVIESKNREMSWFADSPAGSKGGLEERAHIISVSTTPVGDDPLGEISSGTLVLHGRCLHATEKNLRVEAMTGMERGLRGISEEDQPYRSTRGLVLHRGDDDRTEIMSIVPPYEWNYDGFPNDDLYEDVLLMEIVEDETWSVSLAFAPAKTGQLGVYERVGMAPLQHAQLKGAFQQWGEDRTLTVI
jgi:hypothetical protein